MHGSVLCKKIDISRLIFKILLMSFYSLGDVLSLVISLQFCDIPYIYGEITCKSLNEYALYPMFSVNTI